MYIYKRKINYYETDKMGITHHSNYLRFMEEARIAWMESIDCDYLKCEKLGIFSPVLKINCDYKKTTTFNDEIDIIVKLVKYNGIRIVIEYEMTLDKKKVLIAQSEHCFINKSGKPVNILKEFKNIHEIFNKELEKDRVEL